MGLLGGGVGSTQTSPPSSLLEPLMLRDQLGQQAGGIAGRTGDSGSVSSNETSVGSSEHHKCGSELFICECCIQKSPRMDSVLAMQNPSSPEQIHKQGPRLQQRWQNYIENQQQKQSSSAENLLVDSDGQGYSRLRSDSFSSGFSSSSKGSVCTTMTDLNLYGSMPRSPGNCQPINRTAFSHGTLPRSPAHKMAMSHLNSNCNDFGHTSENGQSFTLSSPPSKGPGIIWQSRPAMTLQGNQDTKQQFSPVRRLSFSNQHIPSGIAEVERMYKPMKNLNSPLPNAPQIDGLKMPAPYLMQSKNVEDFDDAASVMGEIPPPPPPVQSHAILETGLGHHIPVAPRTPGTLRKIESGSWPKPPNMPLPPLPPKRTSSRLSEMIRPNNLNLSNDSDNSIYARPKAYLNRTSLMSTGSSDSGSSSAPSDQDLPLSPITPSSELMFTWPNYSVGSPSPTEHRSISQVAGRDSDSINTSMISQSSQVYMKMSPMPSMFDQDNPDSHYMNLLYSAVQQQGGVGSVENAMSPYLEMTAASNNVKHLKNASVDTISSIYAQIESQKGSSENISQAGVSQGVPPLPVERNRGKTSTRKSTELADLREMMIAVNRKRLYRVGLNLFNTNPDMGIDYFVKQNIIDLSPLSVAKFLFKSPGLAKAKIGEYLGQINSAFCMKVLSVFMEELDLSNLRIDKALRKLLELVIVPGEAQKIEKIMEVFGKRYTKCNSSFVSKLKCSDSVVTLAFATMLLNTDLHNPNLKPEKKMIEKEFMNNLKSSDDGNDFDSRLLKSIYKGVKKNCFTSGIDHVNKIQHFQANLIGKAPYLVEPHRRLVCICRLAEVVDIHSKKPIDSANHFRDIWLFNDLLVVTKAAGKSNGNIIYQYKECFTLRGTEVTLFHTPVFTYGIQISRKTTNEVLITLNADSEEERYKFVMDVQEHIFEMDTTERALKEANMIK